MKPTGRVLLGVEREEDELWDRVSKDVFADRSKGAVAVDERYLSNPHISVDGLRCVPVLREDRKSFRNKPLQRISLPSSTRSTL